MDDEDEPQIVIRAMLKAKDARPKEKFAVRKVLSRNYGVLSRSFSKTTLRYRG